MTEQEKITRLAEKAAIRAGLPQTDKESTMMTYWGLHNLFVNGYLAGYKKAARKFKNLQSPKS